MTNVSSNEFFYLKIFYKQYKKQKNKLNTIFISKFMNLMYVTENNIGRKIIQTINSKSILISNSFL